METAKGKRPLNWQFSGLSYITGGFYQVCPSLLKIYTLYRLNQQKKPAESAGVCGEVRGAD
ncbi:hypothetical protein DRW41_06740 [Neobacillus piezotolerans]|uniref:Uncharacterized protein n=1 Tax=Neobacillus piezotolerans TaxID=2259171 RepID=A0A3D8GSV0_9BACI|nr:hypothetical protein DRW41_06740 [Neobacillus piezotolerans]